MLLVPLVVALGFATPPPQQRPWRTPRLYEKGATFFSASEIQNAQLRVAGADTLDEDVAAPAVAVPSVVPPIMSGGFFSAEEMAAAARRAAAEDEWDGDAPAAVVEDKVLDDLEEEEEEEEEAAAAEDAEEDAEIMDALDASDPSEGYDDYTAPLRLTPDRLRASDLNELLMPDYLSRHKFNVSPMQAFGTVFKWDAVLTGLGDANLHAWEDVSEKHGFRVPTEDDVLRSSALMPELAIQRTFGWTSDWGECQKLAIEYKEHFRRTVATHTFAPQEGAIEWLTLLKEYEVPRTLLSPLDLPSTDGIIASADMEGFFDTVVSAEDGAETDEQGVLVSAIKMKRPPARCVFFVDDPYAVTSAHDAGAKAVAVMGKYPGYELKHAERRVSALDELSLMALREIFAGDLADGDFGPDGSPTNQGLVPLPQTEVS